MNSVNLIAVLHNDNMRQHMGRLRILSIPLFFLFFSCAGYNVTDPAFPIEVGVNDEFTIMLSSNPSTGHHWEITNPLDESKVTLIKKEFFGRGCMTAGAGGTDLWRFRAKSEGATEISMGHFHPYDRLHERPGPLVTYSIRISK
jgi:predicted secreted protein